MTKGKKLFVEKCAGEQSVMLTNEMNRIILLFVLLISIPTEAMSEIYKWKDANGKIHFSDKKPEDSVTEEIKLRINTYESVSYDQSIFDTGNQVIMYSTEWCAYCKKAKRYFARKGIPYTEYDIEKNREARARYRELDARGVPVILVGKKRMNGFSEKGFEQIYN